MVLGHFCKWLLIGFEILSQFLKASSDIQNPCVSLLDMALQSESWLIRPHSLELILLDLCKEMYCHDSLFKNSQILEGTGREKKS